MRLRIVWRNLSAKPLQSMVTVAIVALAVALTVTLMLLAEGIHQGLVRATEPFDLIVGAKGSPIQLVLNTVFLQDTPIGNIEEALVDDLAARPGVAAALPMGFGDNYRGYRIVGTAPALFEQRVAPSRPPWLQLAEGRPFRAQFEAVIGAKAARDLRIKVGETFASVHGLSVHEQGEAHGHNPYRVVGILKPVGGPYDQAILVSMESIWHIHEHHEAEEDEAAEEEHDGHEHGVTAILVKPRGYADAMRLYQQFQSEPRAQLVFPAQVIVQFFALMGQGEQVLQLIAALVIAMTLLTVALTLYGSAQSRSREQAVLRAIGANAGDIFRIILLEGVVTVGAGLVCGLLVGHGLFGVLAGILQQQTAITIGLGGSWKELVLAGGVVGFGLLASLAPAALAYRFNVARNL
ncbi:putative ABC transport system permease protein [Hydrogenispora ethanolica]|uniref:Putative hemin transport system permease protein HrtB n=1 Tax=Hydrogenispora ethanolica TaxID=1082276 RepID=A0A4R1SD33_HYDET|nr:ABC transporter permease [Hydrogenispora ethanolica]TCL76940.1 putative ABC transport system permease protein [Hydrogenispora ethanolica]